MEFVTVNYALNEMYRVDKSALLEAANHALATFSNFLLSSLQIELGKTSDDITLAVYGKLAADEKLDTALESISNALENAISNLTNTRPKNVALHLTGRF